MNKFLKIISKKLEENDFSYALQVLSDVVNGSELDQNVRDLISLLFKNINKESNNMRPDLVENSCQLLEVVAEKAEPEEVVLEFLEHMDNADRVKFSVILRCLKICLDRCTQNKLKYLETTLVTIRSCLEDIMISDRDFAAEELFERELSKTVEDVSAIFLSVLDFYEKYVREITATGTYERDDTANLFLSRLLQMLDFFNITTKEEIFTPLHTAKKRAIELILSLMCNPFKLVEYLFFKNLRQQNTVKERVKPNYENVNLRLTCDDLTIHNSDENISVFENNDIISDLSYAVFFHAILSTEYCLHVHLPYVYNPRFVFLSLAQLSIAFFEKNFNKQKLRGLDYFLSLFDLLDQTKLSRPDLYFRYHEKLVSHLVHLMIYSPDKITRVLAWTCFKKYIDAFDYEAKYLLYHNIRPKIDHPGTLGIMVTQLKEYISHFMDYECDQCSKYYSGKLLYDLISEYCFLTHGEKTDLVSNADQILSSLNLFRFVLLKDKNNKTGLRNYLPSIEEKFFKPLRNGIASTKNYYKERLEDLDKRPNQQKERVELTINERSIQNLTKEQQKNSLMTTLNAVELIDSVMKRVQECVDQP